jgi:hypothetical protein
VQVAQQLKVLWGAILSSTALISAMPLMIPVGVGDPGAATVLLVGGAGLFGPLASLAWGRAIATTAEGNARWLPRWALAEAGACCGLVNHFVGGPSVNTWSLCALALLVVFLQFPRTAERG